MTQAPLNVLFVCSKNRWRSPTAEAIYRDDATVACRSAGTSSDAKHTVTAQDITWADIIFVMEPKHNQRLTANHPQLSRHKPIRVLDIPDDYQYMDEDLITEIKRSVDPFMPEPQ